MDRDDDGLGGCGSGGAGSSSLALFSLLSSDEFFRETAALLTELVDDPADDKSDLEVVLGPLGGGGGTCWWGPGPIIPRTWCWGGSSCWLIDMADEDLDMLADETDSLLDGGCIPGCCGNPGAPGIPCGKPCGRP